MISLLNLKRINLEPKNVFSNKLHTLIHDNDKMDPLRDAMFEMSTQKFIKLDKKKSTVNLGKVT